MNLVMSNSHIFSFFTRRVKIEIECVKEFGIEELKNKYARGSYDLTDVDTSFVGVLP